MNTTIKTGYAQMHGIEVKAGDVLDGGWEDIALPADGFFISDCGLFDMSNQGRGYGKALYMQVLITYGRTYSAWPVSEDAQRVHDSLLRSGQARHEFDEQTGLISLILNT